VYIYCLSHSLHSLHHLFVVSPILARNEARRALPPRNNWTRNDHRDPSRERRGGTLSNCCYVPSRIDILHDLDFLVSV